MRSQHYQDSALYAQNIGSNKKMNLIKYIALISFALSCNPDNINNSKSIEELIQTVIKQNNYHLNICRDANRYILRIHANSSEKCSFNLVRLDELYGLNNSKKPNFDKLKELIEEYNKSAKPDRIIEFTSLDKSNRIEYYLYLHKIIEFGNYTPGSVNEPRVLLPYAIDNNEFYAFKGDTILVPIKSFEERDVTHWKYELVDTLNFTKIDDNEGYFSVLTVDKKIGITEEKLTVYGRNIYTNIIEKIGTSEIKCMIREK